MKQLILEIIASVCALCMLAGCAAPAAASGADANGGSSAAGAAAGAASASSAETGAGGDAAYGPAQDSAAAPLRVVSGLRDNTSWGCGSENGFYSLLARSDGSVNIRYLDYQSLREIILCGNPDCAHNSESCTGWIAPGSGGAVPFATEKYFCLVYLGNTYGLTDGVPPKIVRRDLNGQNETTLAAFSASETILRPFVSDGHSLYFLKRRYQLDMGAPQGMYELMRLDLETGADAVLAQWEEVHTVSLAGANDGKLLVRDIHTETENTGTTPASHMVCSFLALDPDTGASAEVWSWKTQAEISERGDGRVLDGNYYYYDAARSAVMRHDFSSGKTTVLLADAPELLTGAAGACFDCIADGRLYIRDGVGFYAAVSTEDGAMTEHTLSYTEGDKTRPVRIVESVGDSYLVVSGAGQVIMHGFDYDGLPIEFPSFEDTLALIAKQDYWNDRPNYIPLERYNGT